VLCKLSPSASHPLPPWRSVHLHNGLKSNWFRKQSVQRSKRRTTLNLALFLSLFNLSLIAVTTLLVKLKLLPNQAMSWTLFGIAGLAGLWLAFGGLRAPWRQLIWMGLLALISVIGSANRPLDSLIGFLQIFSVCCYWYLLLLPLRHFGDLQWGMVHDAPIPPTAKAKFSIYNMLAFMLLLAAPLACSRALFLRDYQAASSGLIIGATLGSVMFGSMLPLMLALFSNRNALKRTGMAVVWIVLIVAALLAFPLFRYRSTAMQGLGCLPIIAVNLLALRLLGIRWRTFGRAPS
jgi:hypothetical protein